MSKVPARSESEVIGTHESLTLGWRHVIQLVCIRKAPDSYSTLRFHASWSRQRQGEFTARSPSDYVSEHFLCGMWRESEGELNSTEIFLARGWTFEALKWSQNKLHDLGMNAMCWQRHQFTALKATFRAAFLVPTAVLWSSQISWEECKQLGGMTLWDTSMGMRSSGGISWGIKGWRALTRERQMWVRAFW